MARNEMKPATAPKGVPEKMGILSARSRMWLGMALASSWLMGCSGEEGGGEAAKAEEGEPAKKAVVAEEKAAPSPVAATAPPVDPDYSYNSIGKRDPFRSFINRDVVAPVGAGEQLTPLQMFDLEQFKLVAIVWGQQQPIAMVQDPEGTGHVIDVGTLIGKRWGKVTQIKSDEIVITEQYRDEIENRLIVTENSMKLPDASERGGRG